MKKCTYCGRIENDNEMNFCLSCGQRLSKMKAPEWDDEFSSVQLTEANKQIPDQPMFCMNCGIPFNEYGVCVRCGNLRDKQFGVISKPEPYWSKLLDCVKVLFSASPFNGIENAGRETGHKIWPICLGVFAAFTSLGFTNIMLGQSETYYGMEMSLAELFGISGSFSAVLLKALLVAVVFFFTSTAVLWLPLKLSNSKLPFVQLMNINSFVLIPASVVSLAAFLFAFISRDIALFLMPVGILMTVIMLYYAIQKLAEFKSSPFWYFAGALAADSFICLLAAFVVNKLF